MNDLTHTQFSVARLDGYEPVARAIDFLTVNAETQPTLEQTAAHVGLSPAHFQRVFKAGAGVSPKRFLQYLAAQEAKRAITNGEDVLSAAYLAGLSGASRLHDLFLAAEAMTPGDYRRKGAGLLIRFALVEGPLGRVLIGATDKGVCWLSFADETNLDDSLQQMKHDWAAATFVQDADYVTPFARQAFAFAMNRRLNEPLRLHVRGTNFQLKVWEALLRIPYGHLVTYGDIAKNICAEKANRAVGTAVGANLISVLIPCHRVILSSGIVHNYRWGAPRKKAILAMEEAISQAS